MYNAWCLIAFTLIGSLVNGDDIGEYTPPPENAAFSFVENSHSPIPENTQSIERITITENLAIDSSSAENTQSPETTNTDNLTVNSASAENIASPLPDNSNASQIQNGIADNSTSVPAELTQSQDCPLGSQSKRFTFRHLEGEGLGFNKGYSTFEAFLSTSEAWWDHFFPFFDLRAHAFNDGRPAANLGLGGRYLFDSRCHAIGANVYYDFRKTDHHSYNQVGFGLEWLSAHWEFRANGYFPVGKTTTHHFDLEFDHFSNHFLYVRSRKEFAMTGGEIEGGWHFSRMGSFDFFVGGGPYYFKGKLGHQAIGGKVRFVAKIGQYFTLEATDTFDNIFNNRVNGQLSINLPFGHKSKVKKSKSCSCDNQIMLQDWIYDYPERDEIIVTHSRSKTQKALDLSGNPFFLWFVDNRSSSLGTFESPFPTLLQAQTASSPGEGIYVFSGDGTTTGMDAGIMLQANQRFLGAGVTHQFATTLGNVTVPVFSPALPRISGGGLTTVTLNVNNEVSGFQIEGTGAGGPGITGAFTGATTNTNINRNTLITNPAAGMYFTMAAGSNGTFLIQNNLLVDHVGVNGIEFGFIADSDANITIANNTIINAGLTGISIDAPGATVGNSSDVTLDIRGNTIVNSLAEGILVVARGSGHTHSTSITNNTLTYTTAVPSIAMHVRSGDDTIHTVDILNNTFTHNPGSTTVNIFTSRSLIAFSPPTAEVFLTIASNTFRNGGTAISVFDLVGGPGFTQVSIQNNDIRTPLNTAMIFNSAYPVAAPSNLLTGVVQNNIIDTVGSGLFPTEDGIGIFVSGANTPSVNLQFINNTITNVARSGINYDGSAAGGIGRVELISNTIQNTGLLTPQDTIFISNAGTMTAHVVGNSLVNNTTGAFKDVNTGTSMCLRINDNVGNTTPVSYNLDNTGGGTFNTEMPLNNVGIFSILGPVTILPAGSCE